MSDIQHSLSMLAGLEAFSNGDTRSPNAVYAATVLKLHALDAGHVEGSEGFMDAVKKGAKNAKDWIVALIKAIKAYLTDSDRKIAQQRNKVSELGKQIDAGRKKAKSEEKEESKNSAGWITDPKLGDFSKSIESIIADMEAADGVTTSPVDWAPDSSKSVTALKELLKLSEDEKTNPLTFSEKVADCADKVGDVITAFNNALAKWRSTKDDRELGAARMGPDFHKVMGLTDDSRRRLIKMSEAMIKRCEAEVLAVVGKHVEKE